MLYAIVAILVIIADQWLKYWVAGNIALDTGVKELIPGVVSLVNIHNDGAAFGLFSGGNARVFFIIICAVFTVAIIVAMATKVISGGFARWSAVLIMAGGIANCIDRVVFGYVQDMFRVDFVNFAIFNVADIFITVFCIILILYLLFGGEKPEKRKKREEESYDYESELEDVRQGELYVEEDDEEEDETPIRAFLTKKKEERQEKVTRKDRQARYADEFEQFKAARAARQQDSGEPARYSVPTPPPAIDPNDPFAEWERANARIEQEKRAPYADFMSAEEVFATAEPAVEEPAAMPVFETAAAAVEEPAPIKAAEFEFEQQSIPVTAKPKSSDDFDLDDILAEFK